MLVGPHPGQLLEIISGSHRAGLPYSFESALYRKDGSSGWFEVFCAPMQRTAGQPRRWLAVGRNIDARRRSEDIATQLELVVKQMPAVLWAGNLDLRFTLSHGAGLAGLGLVPGQLVGMTLFEYFQTEDPNFPRILEARRALSGEVVNAEIAIGELTFEVDLEPLRNRENEIIGIIGISQDISARKQAEARLAYLAYHDSLTGLPNRASVTEHLRTALLHAKRHSQYAAVLYLDLDGFSAVNDSLGHIVGDEVLKAVGMALRGAVREGDYVARLGGDEFLIVLDDVRRREDVLLVADALQRCFSTVQLDGWSLPITASIGAAVYPEDGADPESLVRHADAALYRAKHTGGHGALLFA